VLWRYAISILVATGCLAQQGAPLEVEEAMAPDYPAAAVTGGVSGGVVVEVRVSQRGAVESATVVEGDALLRQPSIDAARLWRFRAQAGSRAGSQEGKLVFSFRLMPKNTPEAQLGTIFRPPYTVEVRRVTPKPVSHFARNSSPHQM
jgi:TonB family protein